MEKSGVVSASADPSPSLGEVPAVVAEMIGGSDEQEDPSAAASAVVDEQGDDGPAAAEEDGEGEGISDDEEASDRRRGKRGEEEEEGQEEGERVVKDPPYEYPTGLVEIDEQELAPAGNIYDSWAATPGVTGEALDNVTLTLKFEAMGAQDLTVGLAHKSGGKGGMYQLIIGNKGNLQVDLEKIQQGRRGETVASSAGLLCASKRAHRYWVAVKHGRLDFGVGDVCGQRTVLSYQDTESPIEVRYVGFTCLRHRAVFRDIKMEAEAGTGPLGPAVETELEFVRAEGCDEGFSGEDKESLDAALEQYRQECENMKRRARKFGGAYSPPFLQDWVPWTLVKRLSWNRDAPMDGGIDRESKEEREKQKLRAERFGGPEAEPPSSQDHQNPLAATVDPDVAEMMTDEKRYARSQKFNISDQMWSIQAEEQGLQPGDIFCGDPDRADPEPMATTFPHKIHIFSLDKTVCKQIRDNDVKAYFDGFGPKYVEWLSDWSFNVVFDDADGAKKAAAAKSFGLPDTLPKEIEESIGEEGEAVVDLGAMGWRLGLPMCKIKSDRHGSKGQWVRLLLRCAEAQDILLTRPQVPATPEGALVRRAGEGRLPPAVLAAQGLAGTFDSMTHRDEGRRRDTGGRRKRRRGSRRSDGDGGYGGGGGYGGDAEPEEMMGQALKAPRTSSGRRRRGRRSDERRGGGEDAETGENDAAAAPTAAAAATAAAVDDVALPRSPAVKSSITAVK